MGIGQGKGYREIAAALRELIQRGDYPPGTTLPPEDRLAANYRVSRPVVNRAVAALRAEGLVRVERGRGTFVNELPMINRQAVTRQQAAVREEGRGAFDAELRRLELAPRSDLVEVGQVSAPADVSALLGVEAGAPVLIRRREMFANDIPVQLASSYVPWDIAQGSPLGERDTGPGGLYSRLADLGHAPTRFTETITVRSPDSSEAEFLRADEGQRVFVIIRTAIDGSGRAVEICVHVMLVHQWALTYEWSAE